MKKNVIKTVILIAMWVALTILQLRRDAFVQRFGHAGNVSLNIFIVVLLIYTLYCIRFAKHEKG